MTVPFLTISPVCDAILLNVLLPHLAAVRVGELSHEDGVVRIRARAHTGAATCPACGNTSARVHCWYERQLTDPPVAGRRVADRWHLWRNLAEAVERTVTRHDASWMSPMAFAEMLRSYGNDPEWFAPSGVKEFLEAG